MTMYVCTYVHTNTSLHICFSALTYQIKRYAVTHFKRCNNKNWHTRAKSSDQRPRNKYKQQQKNNSANEESRKCMRCTRNQAKKQKKYTKINKKVKIIGNKLIEQRLSAQNEINQLFVERCLKEINTKSVKKAKVKFLAVCIYVCM